MNKKVIIIDLVMLLIAFGFFGYCLKQESMLFSIIGLGTVIAVLAYVIYSFYMSYLYKETFEDRLKKANKHHVFDNYVTALALQHERLVARESVISNDSNSNIVNAYGKIKERVSANIETCISFMESYDYVAMPEPRYLMELVQENDKLFDKLNTLIELNLKVDNTTAADTAQVEDLIQSLEEILHE